MVEVEKEAAAAGSVQLTGAGASFPYPLYSHWFYEYAFVNPVPRISNQSIGSGGGIRQITDMNVDFAGSDAVLNAVQKAAAPGLMMLPTVAGAVVLAYNVQDAEGEAIPTGLVFRYLADVLSGVPSIVIGIFAYNLIVARQGQLSALSGGVALGVMMLPSIVRTTEEMMRMVPATQREASLALGLPRWRTIISVVLPSARSGVTTGILLAVARVAGETAPLLFTAFGNPFSSFDVNQPIATLPHTLFTYAISPYTDWQTKAWGTAIILTSMMLLASVLARKSRRRATA